MNKTENKEYIHLSNAPYQPIAVSHYCKSLHHYTITFPPLPQPTHPTKKKTLQKKTKKQQQKPQSYSHTSPMPSFCKSSKTKYIQPKTSDIFCSVETKHQVNSNVDTCIVKDDSRCHGDLYHCQVLRLSIKEKKALKPSSTCPIFITQS